MEEKLIEAVKNHEILYNKNSILYRNKKKRAAAWKEISAEINLPEDICQTRWRYLRDKFVKKISESQRALVSGTEIIEGQWKYQNQMEFLREHIRPRKTETSLSEESLLTEMLGKYRSESVESIPEETLFPKNEFLGDPLTSNTSTSSPIEAPSTSRKRLKRESGIEVRFPRTVSDPHNGFFGMVREMFDKMDPEVVENLKIYFLNYLHEQRTKKPC